ncbi:MAG: membrane protein insertion efficiency factor YidD [Myxococcales bacterium]|nr:MAG: membrane protein insertion efficiency factor YidD [Myxococcales bacterium]
MSRDGSKLGVRIALVLVQGYRMILSPWLGPACRFEPSCSSYAVDAIRHHGILRGCYLALRRVARCNPLGGCGYDPVP